MKTILHINKEKINNLIQKQAQEGSSKSQKEKSRPTNVRKYTHLDSNQWNAN